MSVITFLHSLFRKQHHATGSCRQECGCSCGCHNGCHETHHHGNTTWLLPLCSFVLLVVGMLLTSMQVGWFGTSQVRFFWYLAAFLPVGLPVLRDVLVSFRNKDYFNEFTLMLLASIGAFGIGAYSEAVAVMLFYTVGELFQHRAVDQATRDISSLLDVRPQTARVLREHTCQELKPEQIQVGEQIEVRPGERVPLDGALIEGEALLDTSALTGESLPRIVEKGGEVLAGMIVQRRTVHLRVVRGYHQSALARILALVQDASERKAPAELFIRRFARIYTPLVVLLAVLLVVVPALVHVVYPPFPYVFAEWLYRGLVFLVISCPCALVISVPLSYFAGIGKASRLGILFKGGNYLDAVTHVDAVAFDKTGTLTTGCFEVERIETVGIPEEELLRLVATVEQGSTHPIAVAIVEYARRSGVLSDGTVAVTELSGYGLEAVVGERQVLVGQIRLLSERNIAVPEVPKAMSQTVVVCAVDGKYAGALFLADKLKADAAEAVKRLNNLGIDDLAILSGDRKEVVEEYARRLGIRTALGELLPADKAAYVARRSEEDRKNIAFVGDGLNDAPVLALSDVGIVMGGLGSDAAIESADVVIQTDQPVKVAMAIQIGRYTRKIVRQNIFGAIGIKILVLLAGALGYASLWGAVFADVGVALLAILNAMRIFGKKFDK